MVVIDRGFFYCDTCFMHIVMKFPLKPISTNEAHRAIKRGQFATVIKSEQYRRFEEDVLQYIDNESLSKLESIYDRKKHVIQARVIYFNPNFFTKDGKISLTGGDLNHHKQIIDSILKNTSLNDACIKNINDFQFPTNKDHHFEVHLHLQELEKYLQLAK